MKVRYSILVVLCCVMSVGCQSFGNPQASVPVSVAQSINAPQTIKGITYRCLAAIMDARHHAVCNNLDLQRWEQWKAKSPNAPIGQGAYEKDLFSGRIFKKGECPREGWPRLWHWCLD